MLLLTLLFDPPRSDTNLFEYLCVFLLSFGLALLLEGGEKLAPFVRSVTIPECEALADHVLQMDDPLAILETLREHVRPLLPGAF